MVTLWLSRFGEKIKVISPTRDELLADLVTYIAQATGLDTSAIIRGKQNAPSPLNQYCSVLYLTDLQMGTPSKTRTVNDIDDTLIDLVLRGKRQYDFSVQFYRGGATDLAKELMMYYQTPAGVLYEQTSLFSVNRIVSVNENATVMSNNYEERAILTLELIVNETQTIVTSVVEEVDLLLTYDGDSLVERTIEVKNE